MKKYMITAFYTTGDSFSTYEATHNVELKWDNLEIAQENLERIRSHYIWYRDSEDRYQQKSIPQPKWHKNLSKNLTDFFLQKHIIFLKTDEGKEMQYSPPWVGYFECLHEVKIGLSDIYKIEF